MGECDVHESLSDLTACMDFPFYLLPQRLEVLICQFFEPQIKENVATMQWPCDISMYQTIL